MIDGIADLGWDCFMVGRRGEGVGLRRGLHEKEEQDPGCTNAHEKWSRAENHKTILEGEGVRSKSERTGGRLGEAVGR
ncbi:MAG: hypothetical protein SNJ84_06220 [Verrucomicrobiia bacterium]